MPRPSLCDRRLGLEHPSSSAWRCTNKSVCPAWRASCPELTLGECAPSVEPPGETHARLKELLLHQTKSWKWKESSLLKSLSHVSLISHFCPLKVTHPIYRSSNTDIQIIEPWGDGELYLGLIFQQCRVDKPLSAGPDDNRLLRPPVIRVTVDTRFLLHQSATVSQHGDH